MNGINSIHYYSLEIKLLFELIQSVSITFVDNANKIEYSLTF
jgi:hypothetical protein